MTMTIRKVGIVGAGLTGAGAYARM